MKRFVLALFFLPLAIAAAAQQDLVAPSPYAGQETRAIKSLSDDDLAELRRGGGWGLAKAAELNGMPGPAHLLELKDAIPLSPEQVAEITAVYEGMRSAAIAEGEQLIAGEETLEAAFRDGSVSEESLREMLATIEASRGRLRFIHLATHLKMPALLSAEQIARYNTLRGYDTDADPCANVPEGHDPEMWRRHNNCG